MSNRVLETIVIGIVVAISYAAASYSPIISAISAKEYAQNYAQILTEILGVIFVLPQVIIQLTLRPQRKDIKEVFSGYIPFYFVYYIAAIVILGLDYSNAFFPHNKQSADTLILFIFLSSLILIFPYMTFLIKEYSTSKKIFSIRGKKIIKRIKKLIKLNQDNETYAQLKKMKSNSTKKVEEEILDLMAELSDYILTYGKEDYDIFSTGIDTIAKIIETTFNFKNANIDNLLIEILGFIKEIGIKISNDAQISKINDRLYRTTEAILFSKEPEKRINLLVTKILSIIEKIMTEGTIKASSETTRKTIFIVNGVSLNGLRHSPSIKLEYHLLAEILRKLCIFSIQNSYVNCALDVLEDLGYMLDLSIDCLPASELPVYKICDVFTEIGILTSQKGIEIITIQTVNRMIFSIANIRARKIPVDLDNCMASLLELAANIWVNYDVLEKWLSKRLKNMKSDYGIDFKKYIKPTQRLLESKSLNSEAIFSDFLDQIMEGSATKIKTIKF